MISLLIQPEIIVHRINENFGLELYERIEEDREALKNLVWAKDATLSSTTKWLEEKDNGKDQVYGIFIDQNLHGVFELRYVCSGTYELGYWLGTPYRGNGYMQKIVKEMTKDSNINYIAHCREKNWQSSTILFRNNFKLMDEMDKEHYYPEKKEAWRYFIKKEIL